MYKVIPIGCALDCGGRFLVKGHVKDGKIVKFEPFIEDTLDVLKYGWFYISS
jgi:hypothetical protein